MVTRFVSALLMPFALLTLTNAKIKHPDDRVVEVQKTLSTITTQELVDRLKKHPNTPIIDVRTRQDIVNDGGFIKANQVSNIPRGILEFMIAEAVKENDTFVVHCSNGKRSAFAAARLKEIGYKNVLYYRESFAGWKKAGLPTSSLDRYVDSMLYRPVEKVADGVYASIGQTSPSTYENSGHNNNLGFIVGNKAVLVWNAGGNYLLAKSLHEAIKKVTDKPVKYVVLENSQGHAMLGSSYWKEQGAQIIAHAIAKQEITNKGESILKRRTKTLRDKLLGTQIVLPDITFKDTHRFDLGGRIVEAYYFGYAHEHSDICIWLPKEKIVFAGDLAFHQRLLPIFEITRTEKWLEAWEKLAALKAEIVIPGHGDVTDMPTVTKYTKDYLVYLRTRIKEILDNDGDLNDAYAIDMSTYEHLDTFKELGKQNIARLYKMMEFE